jgi:phosphoenolpyruvate carboxykinase (GTP)
MAAWEKSLDFLKPRLSISGYDRLSRIDNTSVIGFIAEYVKLCDPARVYVSVGTEEDLDYVKKSAISEGEETPLAIVGHTNHFDSYDDQGRDREHTKILISDNADFGMRIRVCGREPCLTEMRELLKNIMGKREMFVAFYCLGPLNSEFAIPCVQITDSSYVIHSENILYRQGYEELIRQGDRARPFKFVHSEGELSRNMTSKNVEKREVYIDLEGETVFSVNTQYGGNTIGLKKLGMRLGIRRASNEGWLNEHMLIMAVHGPDGRRTYFTGAFPSMCGKTSTAMVEGETIVGDDIAFLRKRSGSIYAVNIEKGIFGIIQGINSKDDPIQWEVLHKPGDIIFSNVLVTPGGGLYWSGADGPVPQVGRNHSGEWWPGKRDKSGIEVPISHPNARFNVALDCFRNVDPGFDSPEGVRIGGIMYGGRDSDTSVPVQESFGWVHGMVTIGASLESETTAATLGAEGIRELNPMSNLDFLSIPISSYVRDNLEFGKGLKEPPAIFGINYFLRGRDGKFLNGKNDKRVWLKWMELRVHGDVGFAVTPTGRIPLYQDLKALFRGVLFSEYSSDSYSAQFRIRVPENLAKLERVEKAYSALRDPPSEIFEVFHQQRERLLRAKSELGDYIDPDRFPLVERE